MTICDCHTHKASHNAIVSATPAMQLDTDICYSVGIHPWHSEQNYDMAEMETYYSLPNVVAVGETGIDKLRGADEKTQISLLEQHINLSEQYNLPLILHSVKSWQTIVELKKKHKPRQPWIIHGFRQNAQTAQMLMRHNIYLSFGQFFNTEALLTVPDSRLLIETDDSPMTINEIAHNIAIARNTSADAVLSQSALTISTLFTKINHK